MNTVECKNPGCVNVAVTRKGYCSHRCSVSHLCKLRNATQKGKLLKDIFGEDRAREIAARRGKSISKKNAETGYLARNLSEWTQFRKGKTYEEAFGKEVATSMRAKISKFYSGKSYEVLYSAETARLKKFRMSQSMRKRHASSEYKPISARIVRKAIDAHCKKYLAHDSVATSAFLKKYTHYYDGIVCQSSYESMLLAFLKAADSTGCIAKRFPGSMFYELDGRKHVMYPDFALYRDGRMIAVLEAKGEHLLHDAATCAKLECMSSYCASIGAFACLFTKAFRKLFFYGNPDPSQCDSLLVRLQSMQLYLTRYLACWKEQRLIVENDEFNKTIKTKDLGSFSPNATFPRTAVEENDIVRFPSKGGCHA